MQVRFALYPQLEITERLDVSRHCAAAARHWLKTADAAAPPPTTADMAAPAADAAAAPAAEAEAAQHSVESLAAEAQRFATQQCRTASTPPQVVQRYAAARVCRPGPAFPPGATTLIAYLWTGPVEAADTVRFIYVGPVVLFFWRLLGVITLAALFLWLARLSYGSAWRCRVFRRRSAAALLPAAAGVVVLLMPVLGMAALGAGRCAAMSAPTRPATICSTELKTAAHRRAALRAELRGDRRSARDGRRRPARESCCR